MLEIRTAIDIAAPPERVWSVLTDFGRYPEWNPCLTDVRGEPAAGARLAVRVETPGGPTKRYHPTVLESTPPRELRWLGGLWLGGLFEGHHSFILVPQGDGTHLVNRETYTGLLVPLFAKMLETNTRQGFEAMNRALKQRAEGGG